MQCYLHSFLLFIQGFIVNNNGFNIIDSIPLSLLPSPTNKVDNATVCPMKDCTVFDCFNDYVQCNETHYLIASSRASCERMSNPENLLRFNRAGQAWSLCTKQCQQDYLRNYIQRYTPVHCAYLAAALSESAMDCHIECGFCSICKDSRIALLKMLKHRSLSLLKRDAEFRGTIKRCGGPAACALPLT